MVLDDSGTLAGIIAEADVVRAVAAGEACSASVRARDIMRACNLSCAPHTPASDLLERMSENRVQHLPVLSEGKRIGIVSLGDVLRLRREKIRERLEKL